VGGGLEIELRLDGNGIGESDIAAFERETGAVESSLAFENIDAAETAGRPAEPRMRRSASPESRAIAVRIWSSGAVTTWMSSFTLLSGELAA